MLFTISTGVDDLYDQIEMRLKNRRLSTIFKRLFHFYPSWNRPAALIRILAIRAGRLSKCIYKSMRHEIYQDILHKRVGGFINTEQTISMNHNAGVLLKKVINFMWPCLVSPSKACGLS